MVTAKPKVSILYSEITPYRLALFEELSRHVDLLVNFSIAKSNKRLWIASTKDYSFQSRVLRHMSVGPLVINYVLPYSLIRESYDIYIADDDPRLILSRLVTFIIAKLRKKPFIVWSETIGESYFGRLKNFVNIKIISPLNRFIYSYVDAFLTSGNKTADFLVARGLSTKPMFIGTQALSEQYLHSTTNRDKALLKAEYGFSGKKVVLFVGYLVQRKGIFELVRAFEQLHRRDAILVMAGKGADERQLKELAGHLENVIFPGYVDGQEKARYYSMVDLFVLPTLAEPWGLVIMEAMMFGLPVITTTAAGASELIRGNGIVIEPGDQKALAEAIQYLLANDKIREKMGRESKQIIKEYTVQKAASTFTQAISFCLNGQQQLNEATLEQDHLPR